MGFTFDIYRGNYGDIFTIKCVTGSATLVKFTQRNGVTTSDFVYSTNPTILYNQQYILYKEGDSKLLNVYGLIISSLDYRKDAGLYECHTSDGSKSHAVVEVTGRNS